MPGPVRSTRYPPKPRRATDVTRRLMLIDYQSWVALTADVEERPKAAKKPT